MGIHGASARKEPAHRDVTISSLGYRSVPRKRLLSSLLDSISYSFGMMIHIRT